MEKHFLDDFIRQIDRSAKLGSHRDRLEPWYNQYGDCIEFQTIDKAFVADRIDEYLTIYRAADNNEPIGFQIKDVRALVDKYGYDGLALKAEVKEDKLVSVTALLFAAYESLPASIGRRAGYISAMTAIQKAPPEHIEVAVA